MTEVDTSSLSRRYAEFAVALAPDTLSREVVHCAKLRILDAIGIGLAASTYDFAQCTARATAALGGSGSSPVLGMPLRLPLRDAVLLNGVLIHGLDFDDTHSASVVHASASAVPIMLGCGLAVKASGRRALAAYLLAIELDARLGMVARGTLQKRGWHPTGVIGAFGGTAAAGYLEAVSAAELTHALGITLSMASGNLEFLQDGAWTKRLHPGWAGVTAITAVQLAKAGFVGPRLPFEGRFGLYRSLLGPDFAGDPAPIAAGLGNGWEVENIALKPYPACHFVHAFIDAALTLREQGLDPTNIAGITASIHPDEIAVVCEPETAKREPQNHYEAQFSLHYAVAAAFCRGRFTLAELDAEARNDPAILALAARISYREDATLDYPRFYPGALTVTLTDGREFVRREPVNRGARENPLSDGEILAKYFDNAERAVDRQRAERIRAAIMELEHAPDLVELADSVCLG